MTEDVETKAAAFSPFGKLLDGFLKHGVVIFAVATASLYFVGSSYRRFLAERYGLLEPPTTMPVNEVISIGAGMMVLPLLGAIYIVAGLLFALVMTEKRRGRNARERLHRVFGSSSLNAIFAIFFLFAGLSIAGRFAADREIKKMELDVYGPCKNCWTYRLEDRDVRGVPIFADDDVIYVVGKSGSLLIKKDGILSIIGSPSISQGFFDWPAFAKSHPNVRAVPRKPNPPAKK